MFAVSVNKGLYLVLGIVVAVTMGGKSSKQKKTKSKENGGETVENQAGDENQAEEAQENNEQAEGETNTGETAAANEAENAGEKEPDGAAKEDKAGGAENTDEKADGSANDGDKPVDGTAAVDNEASAPVELTPTSTPSKGTAEDGGGGTQVLMICSCCI